MRERETERQPKPDILTKQFVEGVHPYTMMFLFLAYKEGAHEKLPEQYIKRFDSYFTGDKTIEHEKNDKFRENLEALIRDGFGILRQNTSDILNQFFNEKRLPYFKIDDIPYVSDADIEFKKRNSSNRSMILKGRRFTDEAKEKMRLAKLGTKQSDETIAKRMEKVNELWRNEEFRRRMKIISDSRRKAKQEH